MSELSGKSKRSIMGSILPKAKPPKEDPTDTMSFLDHLEELRWRIIKGVAGILDRKSTRLNSSHVAISYAVFCLKKKRRMRTCAAKRTEKMILKYVTQKK